MPRRVSSRARIRALTRGVGRRSSSANIIRRRMVSLTPRGLFMVQRVGVGASSSSRCTSVPEPAGAAASRFSRSSARRSPSLSMQTSPALYPHLVLDNTRTALAFLDNPVTEGWP